jgi:hypothetical protein
MATVVEVWNLGLARIGHFASIESEEENSQEAGWCRQIWETARDTTLRAAPWGFARAYATLADLGSPPTSWQYRYRYPIDCAAVRHLVTGDRMKAIAPIPFEIAHGGDDGGKVILTDQEDAEVQYTRLITDMSIWDPQAVHALSWLIGAELALAVTSKSAIREETFRVYQADLAAAWTADFNERQPVP